ncbi:unknown [Bacteroides sp. CAG:545]|nr:unknown [Bacteroides sp. CAG:545]
MRKITYCILILSSMAAIIPATGKEMADSLTVPARKVDFSRLKESADSLTKAYKFNAAVELLQNAKEAADSADAVRLDEMMVPAQNGSNMTGFCTKSGFR